MVSAVVPEFFSGLESAISLLGPYDHVKRAVVHHLLGATLMPTIIQHGKTYTDTRVPLMVAIESGHGKGEIERAIRTYADGGLRPVLDSDAHVPLLTYEKPTTRHEQQLLGYMSSYKDKETGKVVWVPHRGFLSNDLLMLNEAFGEMADPTERDFRAFMNTALDPHGRNEIFKQNLREGALRYMPTVSPCVMMQEQPVPADVWYSGSSRRYLWVVAERITKKQRYAIMHDVIMGERVPAMSVATHEAGWRIRNKAIKDGYRFNYGAVAHSIEITWRELYNLASSQVERVRSLPRSMMFNLRDLIYKLATNYAVARLDEIDKLSDANVVVDITDLNMARADLFDFIPGMVRYLDQHLVTAEIRFLSTTARQIVSVIAQYGPIDEFATVEKMMSLGMTRPGMVGEIFRELMVLRLAGVIRMRGDLRDEVPGSAAEDEDVEVPVVA